MLIRGINQYHTQQYENSYQTLKKYILNNKSHNEIYVYLASCTTFKRI